MKRVNGMLMAMAATALFGALGSGCAKKAEAPAEVPVAAAGAQSAEVAKVEGAAAKVEAKAGEVTASAGATVAKAEAGHEGCAGAETAAAGEKDCPFHEEQAAAAQPAVEGCGAHAVTEPTKVEGGAAHFGESFAIAQPKTLGEALTGAVDGQELSVRVSGTIEKVCQKRGCWLVVKDGASEARVVMKGGAFTVPTDSQGKKAQVEGLLKVRIFTEAQAKHLAEDGGEDPSKVTGEKKELLITATAVEIGG